MPAPSYNNDIARSKDDTADLYDLVARIEKRQRKHERRFAKFAERTYERFDGVEGRLDGVGGQLEGLGRGLMQLGQQMAVVIDIVGRLETKVDTLTSGS